MTYPFGSATIDDHYHCLDVLPINWISADTENQSDSGILLEIWRTGGIVQTSVPVPEGSLVELATSGDVIKGQVTACQQDAYGFLVTLSVNDNQYNQWFEQSYCPPYLRREEEETEPLLCADNTIW
jgi:hypothetical protein